MGIFSKDPDVQRKIVEEYFRYEDSQGRSDYPSSDILFKRGTGEYWLRTTDGNINIGQMFWLQRKEGNATELIEVKVGRPEEHSSSINYSASYDSALDISLKYVIAQHKHEGKTIKAKDNGISVNKGRELLAKTQKDFGISPAPAAPSAASSQ